MVLSGPSEVTPSAFVGRVIELEKKTRMDAQREKSLYGHDSAQYLAVEIDRVVFGSGKPGIILLWVHVDATAPGVDWLTGNYGILDPNIWKQDRPIVFFLQEGLQPKEGCPAPWYPRHEGNEGDTELGPVLGHERLTKFDRFRGAPVYCVSVRDVLPIAE